MNTPISEADIVERLSFSFIDDGKFVGGIQLRRSDREVTEFTDIVSIIEKNGNRITLLYK